MPVWSGYTCFAAIAYVVPDDIKDVGYKVYLGRRKYFVSVDVGGGRIQWCVISHLATTLTAWQPPSYGSTFRIRQVRVPQRASGLAQGQVLFGR